MSASSAPVSKLGDRSSLEGVDGTIYGCDSVGHVHEVAHISGLGVEASPHLGGVDIDQATELLISHLMPILDEPYQVAHQQGLVISDLVVRHDDEPRDPQRELRMLTSLAQALGKLDHARLVTEDGSCVPSCDLGCPTVHPDGERNADEWDPDLDERSAPPDQRLRRVQHR
jgi:hypothetical protein